MAEETKSSTTLQTEERSQTPEKTADPTHPDPRPPKKQNPEQTLGKQQRRRQRQAETKGSNPKPPMTDQELNEIDLKRQRQKQ
jgi:hypothetical protein